MRYYDSVNDQVAKGVIDLSDVEAINQGVLSCQGQSQNENSTKKAAWNFGDGGSDSKSCFELRTSKRVYCFCAKSAQEASKWVKQLEMCCLDF